MTNSEAYAGGQPGKLSIGDLDALRAAALQFRASGDTITGLRANTAIADTVSSGLPGTDVEKGVANVDETLKKALQDQGRWLDGLAGQLLGALDQIAQVDQDAAAGLAQDAPAQEAGGPPASGGGAGDGDASGGGDAGSGSGGGDAGSGSGGGDAGSGSGGGSPGGGADSGSQPESADKGDGKGEETPSDQDQPTGAEEADQPVDDQSGDTMSIMGPDGRAVKLSPEQTKNAKAIIEAGKSLGVDGPSVQSALQAALQESGLHNSGSADYPESLAYADKRPDGSPWLSNSERAVGLFPQETGVHADIQTMMDPYAQAARYFEHHAAPPADRAQNV